MRSRDIDRPLRVARPLRGGLVSINRWVHLAIAFGEGGFKVGGVGRLGGTASLDDFLAYQQITQNFVPPAHP